MSSISSYLDSWASRLVNFIETHFYVYPILVVMVIVILCYVWYGVRLSSSSYIGRHTVDGFFLNLIIIWLVMCILFLFYGLVL